MGIDQLIAGAHAILIALIVVVPAVAVALSNACMGRKLSVMIDMQPAAAIPLTRTGMIGTVLSETPPILGLITGLILLWRGIPLSWSGVLVEVGMACALVIPSVMVSRAASYPLVAALEAVARQPFRASRISNWMILLVMLLQVSVLLGFMASLFFMSYLTVAGSGLRVALAGVAFGGGVIGPVLGMGRFAQTSCQMLGLYPESYGKVASFTFVSQALIETPIFFVLGLSVFMVYQPVHALVLAAAGIAVIAASWGAGIASGRVAESACREIAKQPERSSLFSAPGILVQTFIDAAVIYSVVVAAAILLKLA